MKDVYVMEFLELMKERNAVRVQAEVALKKHDEAVFSHNVGMIFESEAELDSAMDRLNEIDELLELIVREANFSIGQIEELERECA